MTSPSRSIHIIIISNNNNNIYFLLRYNVNIIDKSNKIKQIQLVQKQKNKNGYRFLFLNLQLSSCKSVTFSLPLNKTVHHLLKCHQLLKDTVPQLYIRNLIIQAYISDQPHRLHKNSIIHQVEIDKRLHSDGHLFSSF